MMTGTLSGRGRPTIPEPRLNAETLVPWRTTSVSGQDLMLWMARTPYKQTELATLDFYTTGDIGLGLFVPLLTSTGK